MDRRRREARTDETTLTQGLERNLALERIVSIAQSSGRTIDQLINDARDADVVRAEDQSFVKTSLEDVKSPRDVLKKTLSVRSVLSTSSSFAERMEALRDADPKTLKLVQIGRGSFGTVYEIPGTEWCLKKTLTSPDKLWTEYNHGLNMKIGVNQASNAIHRSGEFPHALMPRVPRYLCSYGMDDSEDTKRWFKENGHRFPVENGGQKPGPVICLERIMPLPKLVRDNLIRLYFRPEKQEQALADKSNKSCLCRVYLGCTSSEVAPDKREKELQTLQNFPLYLDQLEELDMKPLTIAQDMALGLAAGHWAVNVNMLDVEYVIGSRPFVKIPEPQPALNADMIAIARRSSNQRVRNMNPVQPHDDGRPSFRNRALQLWMIDFNKIDEFDASVRDNYFKDIEQLVSDTRSTDGPYYPRSLAKTENEWKLWLEFAKTYIRASKVILNALITQSKRVGMARQEDIELVLRRPGSVMNEWMRAESIEYGVNLTRFIEQAKAKGWEMPKN